MKFFFFLILGLSEPSLDRNNAEMFFSFFGIFKPGLDRNEIRDENFSLSFSAYLNSVWIEIMPE